MITKSIYWEYITINNNIKIKKTTHQTNFKIHKKKFDYPTNPQNTGGVDARAQPPPPGRHSCGFRDGKHGGGGARPQRVALRPRRPSAARLRWGCAPGPQPAPGPRPRLRPEAHSSDGSAIVVNSSNRSPVGRPLNARPPPNSSPCCTYCVRMW